MADGRRLLLVVHRHFQLLAGAECGRDRRLDLNDAARLRIATHSRRALAGLKITETGDLHLGALLQLCGDDALVVEQCFDGARGIGLRHLGSHRQRGGEFSLVHCDLLGGGGAETRMNTEELWDIPRKSASLLDFLDPPTPQRRHIHNRDRKSTRLNSSHSSISYAVFCLKKKKKKKTYQMST